MKNIAAALTCGVVAVGAIAVVAPVRAQDNSASGAPTSFPDIPANHWAYQAVSDLAARGYVKGYPDGNFLGQRALTRYEFATVLSRMLATINDLATRVNTPAPPQTPTGNFASVDDLNKIQALVDEFKKELDDIKANTSQLQDQLDAIRQDIIDTKALVAKAQATADSSYGYAAPGTSRKFQLSGFVQARYQYAGSGNRLSFPTGTPAVVGGAASYNGNYAIGGTNQDFFTRRARLKFAGEVNPNTRYAVQLDAANNPTNSNQSQVQILDANFQYTFGNGSPNRYPTIVAGGIINYFGFFLPQSPAEFLTPERPLAFSEGGNGMWQNQDFDKGAYVTVPFFDGMMLTAGVLDGSGRFNQLNKPNPDTMYRLRYSKTTLKGFKLIGIGASYYNGELARASMTNPSGEPTFTGLNYAGGRKDLGGADVQIQTTSGITLLGEYVGGRFDERTFVSAEDTAHSNAPTVLTTNAFAPGNKVDGWYVQAGYTLFPQRVNSLTLAGSYDVFDRSESGISTTTVDDQGNPVLGGASGSSFTDKNWGAGILYKLSRAAQVKLWYEKPTAVAHAAGLPEPLKIGLFTTEFLVRY